MADTTTTGFLINTGNQLDATNYMSNNCTKQPVPLFSDGMGAVIQCTASEQLILSIGPFDGRNLSKLMTFILVWTSNIPDGTVEDYITIKHLIDGVEDTDDTMTITETNLSITHGDALPYYFDPSKEHTIEIYTTDNAVGYNLSFDYVQFNTMNINQVNSSTLSGTSHKPFVNVDDCGTVIASFNNENAITIRVDFACGFSDVPPLIAQCISSYFTIDLDIYDDHFDLTVATRDMEVYTGEIAVNWFANGVATVPYSTKIVEYVS